MDEASKTVDQRPLDPGGQRISGRSWSRGAGPWLLVASWALLLTSWVFSNPPGYGPDEPAHYIKAIGAGRGEFFGGPGQFEVGPGFGPDQLRWINQNTRAIDVPAGLAPDGLPCSAALDPTVSAGCVTSLPPPGPGPRLTYVGTYQPYLYVLPGIMTRFATALGDAMILARLASAATCLVLLSGAVALFRSREGSGLSLLGPVVAVTPMVIFLGSTISANGPEIAASICYLAALLRLTRPDAPPSWVWIAVAVAGAVLVLSRSLGPGFALLGALLPLALIGSRQAWSVLRGGGWWSLGAMAVVGSAMAAGIGWELLRQPQPDVQSMDLGLVGEATRSVFGFLLRQQIGVFGWNEVPLPASTFALWLVMLVALIALAFVVSSGRARLGLVLTLLTVVVASVAVFLAVSRNSFPMQGRYVLPVVVALPLLAGEAIHRHRRHLDHRLQRSLPLLATVIAASVHVTGWVVSAQRAAVGVSGPLWFSGQSQWQPPLGWGLWLAVTLVGGLLMVAAGWSMTSARPGRGNASTQSLAPAQV